MNMKDIRYEFPEMPEEIRVMIKEKVEAQMLLDKEYKRSSKFKTGNKKYRRKHRIIAASLAAALILGITVMAVYRENRRTWSEIYGRAGYRRTNEARAAT